MRTFFITLLSCCAVVLLSGCSSTGAHVDQRLDPRTGVTVRWAREPVILYLDNSAYGAHARKYVSMGPIEVNRMGSYSYYLWFGVWNTVRDTERLIQGRDGFESVVLFVDGTPLPLDLAGWTLDTIGLSEPTYVQPVAGAADAYYTVTLDQIRMIALSRDIELHTGAGPLATYVPWDGVNAAADTFGAFTLRGIN